MTDDEREIMGRHAAYWRPFIDSGQMVIFGPVLDSTGSWGLGAVEAEDEGELRAFCRGRRPRPEGRLIGAIARPSLSRAKAVDHRLRCR